MPRSEATSPSGDTKRPVSELSAHLFEVSGCSVDGPLLLRALTHRSYAYEAGGIPHNERLEFLGDSVLGLVITDALYATHPDFAEGHLAKMRAAVVNMRALAEVARAIGLGDYIHLGRGEETTGGRDKDSILADTLEAVIGAVYLCGGLAAGARLVHALLDPVMAQSATLGAGLDWKTSLQEIASLVGQGSPEYHVSEDGPEHAKIFTAAAVIGGQVQGNGTGRTKKDAEQKAAREAWHALRVARPDLDITSDLPPAG